GLNSPFGSFDRSFDGEQPRYQFEKLCQLEAQAR
ncbi:unnamed protein product, partial [marine sediment metagenome]